MLVGDFRKSRERSDLNREKFVGSMKVRGFAAEWGCGEENLIGSFENTGGIEGDVSEVT